ncbi:hypothetical protein B0H19DRAFT_1232689 [Mycena capillaripes]|nr:hypothetical protein B0H19DRAFT_1243102 [Mycena capillaripes]KAJ6566561.1 hypothetical protein B0H19DRAFT_1232689 [Mycena capillaripes]
MSTPRVQGGDKGRSTASGPSRDTDEEEEWSTPVPPPAAGVTDDEPNNGCVKTNITVHEIHNTPAGNERSPSVRDAGRRWRRRSSDVKLQTNWNQFKPRTRSEGKEAATWTFISIGKAPALDGSIKTPEAYESRERRPHLMAQSRDTEEFTV